MKIKAAVIEKAGDPFKITELELADPKKDEVLVEVTACGVCQGKGQRKRRKGTCLERKR